MENVTNNLQKNPLKLYIQDIFRAQRNQDNKYIYEIFGLTFKNVHIQGVITAIYNNINGKSVNIELSDPTGSVLIYYDSTKNNHFIPIETTKDLFRKYAEVKRFGDGNAIMSKMMDAIATKRQNAVVFEEGSYLSVVGDIFVDVFREIRMVSAFECVNTSVECDVVWLEELRYLYEKFYLWKKDDIVAVE